MDHPRLRLHMVALGAYGIHVPAGVQNDIVRILLAHHADVNATATDGETPLHVAAAHGEPNEIVEVLRQHGGHE